MQSVISVLLCYLEQSMQSYLLVHILYSMYCKSFCLLFEHL